MTEFPNLSIENRPLRLRQPIRWQHYLSPEAIERFVKENAAENPLEGTKETWTWVRSRLSLRDQVRMHHFSGFLEGITTGMDNQYCVWLPGDEVKLCIMNLCVPIIHDSMWKFRGAALEKFSPEQVRLVCQKENELLSKSQQLLSEVDRLQLDFYDQLSINLLLCKLEGRWIQWDH